MKKFCVACVENISELLLNSENIEFRILMIS